MVNLKPYKDPDEFIKAHGRRSFREASRNRLSDSFMFRVQYGQNGISQWMSPRDRTVSSNGVRRCFWSFRDELERNLYIEAIVKDYRGRMESVWRI